MRTLMTHHHALNKDEYPSDPNTPDMKSSPTPRHARIKLRKLGENCSDTATFDMRPPTPRHMNKPKKSGENRSDTNTRDTGSSKTAVVNANLITQGSEVTSDDVSASSTPALEEMKKILDEDSASH